MLCNVSPQANDTQKQLDTLYYTLERLGKKIRLGVTFTTLDMDYGFLIDYIERFKIHRRVRLGIAQPIVGRENECLRPEDYREAGRFIVKMARDLYSRDIIMGFDCGLTLCMFDDEELGSLFRISEGFKMVCNPIIDIGPRMDVCTVSLCPRSLSLILVHSTVAPRWCAGTRHSPGPTMPSGASPNAPRASTS